MKELALKGRTFPSDLNPAGSVFGGWIMAKMDKAASIAVEDIVYSPAVTIAVTDLVFLKPISSGAIFSIYTEIIAIGKSSIKIEVDVHVKCKKSREEFQVTKAIFTFVTVNEEQNSVAVKSVLRDDVEKYVKELCDAE